jgi:hypothetical protein
MKRLLFNCFSAISFLIFLSCLLFLIGDICSWFIKNPDERHPHVPIRDIGADLLIAIVYGALPLAWLMVRFMRTRRASIRGKENLCSSCGYDLRATPDRCPECDNVPEKTADLPAAPLSPA